MEIYVKNILLSLSFLIFPGFQARFYHILILPISHFQATAIDDVSHITSCILLFLLQPN